MDTKNNKRANLKFGKHDIVTLLLLLGALLLISLCFLFTAQKHEGYTFEQNRPWRYETLTADFAFDVLKDSIKMSEEAEEARKNFVRKIIFDNGIKTDKINALRDQFSQYRSKLGADGDDIRTAQRDSALLFNKVNTLYDNGIMSYDLTDSVRNKFFLKVKYMNPNNDTMESVDVGELKYQTLTDARNALPADATLSANATIADFLSTIDINDYIVPNVYLDIEKNNDELASILTSKQKENSRQISQDQVIVRRGEIINEDTYRALTTYFTLQKDKVKKTDNRTSLTGKIALTLLLFVIFYVYMRYIRREVFMNTRFMVFLVVFMTLVVLLVLAASIFRGNMIYVIPFALVPIIISTFIEARTAFFVHLIVTMICSLASADMGEFIVLQFITGLIAIASMKELTKRSQLVRCAFLIFIAYSLSYTALNMARENTFQILTPSSEWTIFIYFAINCVVLSFAYFLIFLVEKVFGFTSTVTLVELADINTPLMRQLADNCPGTFQHVLQVANLADEAAHHIGASSQLVRAGAMYHDIGKLENPAFFTENQSGVNPHDNLTPEQSAKIIISHVTDGLRLAEKAKLPQVVRDMILQHHGKGTAKYFYIMAQKANENVAIDPAPFTYPGPNPKTKEAAILMMADACEAASKSIQTYTEESIANLVNKIIDGQIADGLLADAPISFKDVSEIKKAFIQRLRSFYHTRISYPEEKKS